MKETERDREFHGEIMSTSARSEIFKPSHSHITNNSIYCRCKLTWREGGTEGEREGGRGEREREREGEREREDHGELHQQAALKVKYSYHHTLT